MPHSEPSSAYVSTNDTVSKVVHNDSVRYQRKGYGLVFASLITLAFFYLCPLLLKSIWPWLFSLSTKEVVYFAIVAISHNGLTILINVFMYFVYISKIRFFEKYRVMNKPWPWESDAALWKLQLKKTIKNIAISHLVIVPLLTLNAMKDGIYMRIDTESFPDLKEILVQTIIFMLIEDFLFYWGHRILHHPRIYKHIHKQHHEFSNTVAIAFEYAHPVEYIFTNVLPTNAGHMILGGRVHLATYVIWLIIRMCESADGHCGYEFSWSPYRLLPLSGSSMYHNFHHYQNVGNYCSLFTFWDTICGTNKAYFNHLAKKDEKEESLKKDINAEQKLE